MEAFDHVRRAVPRARLVMVGDGATQAEVQRRARELGLGDAVEFTGKLDWPSVLQLYDEADVSSTPASGTPPAPPGWRQPLVAFPSSG